jgi:hypothetical protein
MVRVAQYAALLALPLAEGQADGNPHNWDRNRRCDHSDYDPPCGACEGVGGYVNSDEANDIAIASCKVEGPYDGNSRKRPVWGPNFSELASHEILIGKKTDPACFQAFPSNDSTAENCYKPQECKIYSDMQNYKALILTANQAGNAWGVAGNVSSVIYHQGSNMWIVNVLGRLGLVNQCVCTSPREGGDPTKPKVNPVQFNWVDNLFYVSTETIGVEYGVGDMVLDHWAFGPHHAWTDPANGLIVRMWQPFNGLQVFEPGQWSEGHAFEDAVVPAKGWFGKETNLFEQLSPDFSKAPDWCTKDAPINTFRIKCQDNGFPVPKSSAEGLSHMEMAQSPVGQDKAHATDLRRAKSKVPRDAYKGDDFQSMSFTLNAYLLKHAPQSKDCDLWTAEELQELQMSLLMLRDPQLNDVYHDMQDNRKMEKDVQKLVGEWNVLNQKASTDPDLARAHRDGHCHEAVMWYVHHLPQGMKDLLKDKISLPLLSAMRHELKTETEHGPAVLKAYEEKVTCASCHSEVYPVAITV